MGISENLEFDFRDQNMWAKCSQHAPTALPAALPPNAPKMLQHQVLKVFSPGDLTSPVFAVGVAAGVFFFPAKNIKIENMMEHQVINSFFVEIHKICDF